MPRRASGKETVALAVRVPKELAEQVLAHCGGQPKFSEWMRNQLRSAVNVPIDRNAGYYEGFAAGWTDANARFKKAVKGAAGG